MSSEELKNGEETQATNDGKIDLMGINIDISTILGDKLVDQFLAQLTPEDMEKLMISIRSDIFDGYGNVKVSLPNQYVGGRNNNKTLVEIVREKFTEKFKDIILEKVEETINSEEYKQKAKEIANELVEYATEGYKKDMKKRIEERLVGNVLDDQPMYNNSSLLAIINDVINNRLRY